MLTSIIGALHFGQAGRSTIGMMDDRRLGYGMMLSRKGGSTTPSFTGTVPGGEAVIVRKSTPLRGSNASQFAESARR
jgi:hypothetical protein